MHNLRLAVLLCINAGFINAAGFFAFRVLTTNVTGHAALLAESIAKNDWGIASIAALWLGAFLLGAFSSSIIINRAGKDRPAAYTPSIAIIIGLVLSVALFGKYYTEGVREARFFTAGLLFAMGMQNALVSVISGSVVRTTHLTGMFTDLGIDLSAWVTGAMTPALKARLLLRSAIIFSFLAGGIAGGLAFLHLSYHAFYFPAGLMVLVLFYDYFRTSILRAARKR
jgi:uncharacterized membrane protein YoaK (UPF0700 family)